MASTKQLLKRIEKLEEYVQHYEEKKLNNIGAVIISDWSPEAIEKQIQEQMKSMSPEVKGLVMIPAKGRQ